MKNVIDTAVEEGIVELTMALAEERRQKESALKRIIELEAQLKKIETNDGKDE